LQEECKARGLSDFSTWDKFTLLHYLHVGTIAVSATDEYKRYDEIRKLQEQQLADIEKKIKDAISGGSKSTQLETHETVSICSHLSESSKSSKRDKPDIEDKGDELATKKAKKQVHEKANALSSEISVSSVSTYGTDGGGKETKVKGRKAMPVMAPRKVPSSTELDALNGDDEEAVVTEKLSLPALKEECKARKIKGVSGWKKERILEELGVGSQLISASATYQEHVELREKTKEMKKALKKSYGNIHPDDDDEEDEEEDEYENLIYNKKVSDEKAKNSSATIVKDASSSFALHRPKYK
jgi:hypothetical protein